MFSVTKYVLLLVAHTAYTCRWGNKEQQCYTASSDNVDVVPHPDNAGGGDGVLRIRTAYSATPVACANKAAPPNTTQWTSAKITTKNRLAFTWAGKKVYYGPSTNDSSADISKSRGSGCASLVVEARMKLPYAGAQQSVF